MFIKGSSKSDTEIYVYIIKFRCTIYNIQCTKYNSQLIMYDHHTLQKHQIITAQNHKITKSHTTI